MLLADARRKHEQRTAKRVANRKSASSSRARKKALIDEMTKANARLRRQAMILALLPDLVIAITVDGTITFCSAQVCITMYHDDHNASSYTHHVSYQIGFAHPMR
jgi:PAS domain-containing protein